MQEPFYIAREDASLFAVYHPPQGRRSNLGIVMCHAFGKEYLLSRTHLSVLARELADRGHAVLRFDYRGYADSSGEFEEATISEMLADIDLAISNLQKKAPSIEVALMGVRLGGTLALLSAERIPQVKHLILWEPILSPWDYIFNELRQTVAMQSRILKVVHFTREQIVENIMAGRPSAAGGYNFNVVDEGFPLTAQMIKELKEVNLTSRALTLNARVLLLHIRAKEGLIPKPLVHFAESLNAQGTECILKTAIDPYMFWKYSNYFTTHSSALNQETLKWCEQRE